MSPSAAGIPGASATTYQQHQYSTGTAVAAAARNRAPLYSAQFDYSDLPPPPTPPPPPSELSVITPPPTMQMGGGGVPVVPPPPPSTYQNVYPPRYVPPIIGSNPQHQKGWRSGSRFGDV